MPRIIGSSFFNGSYIFVDYGIDSQNYGANTSQISWILGFHYGNAHFRVDNAQCNFGGGSISGDAQGGPTGTGWPAPGGQNTDIALDGIGVFTIGHDSNGNRTVTITASCSSDFGSSSINTTFGLPQIPQNPASPSAASASRTSDSEVDVDWTNNSTGTAPYANVRVQRRVDNGSYSNRALLGVVTHYDDTGVSSNHKYQYRMSAIGTNGAEVGYGETGNVWTTPGAPTGCSAVRLGNGNIRVSWSNTVNYSEYTTRIERSTDEGSNWTEVASVANGVTSYDHPLASAPTNDSHKYRVRTRTSSGPTLNSGYSTQSGVVFGDPLAPSAAAVTRVNDGQQNLTWTNNSTSELPYKNIKVYRRTNGGGWANIATLGVVTSYSDTTTSANNKYEYRVSAIGQNDAESGFSTTSAIYTTPAAPTIGSAVKLPSNDIRITWTNNVNYTEYLIELEESTNSGSSWTPLNTSIASGTITIDHVAPSTIVTHMYRLRAKTSSGTTLFSAYSASSNEVQLLATANAPTNLDPSGVSRDANEAILLSWQHNPQDGTPQTSYRIQYEVDGGSTVTIGPTASGVSSHSLPADTLTNAHTITWRVATAGQNGTLSTNSATASFTTRDRPTSTIDFPTGGTLNNSHVTAEWTYFQTQASAQASWHAFLYRDNLDTTYTLLEEKTGTTEDEVEFTTTLLDGLTYAIRVYVTSADGLESIDSGTELETFLIDYLPPASVTLEAQYDPNQGFMVVLVTADAVEVGVTVDIETIDVQRQINGGEWVTWIKGLVLPPGEPTAAVIDTAPTINGINNYRGITHSALPSSAISDEEENVTDERRWGFLSTGAAFSQFVRMRARLDRRATLRRDRENYHFAGRAKPVELSGEHTSKQIAVSATLYGESSTPQQMEDIALTNSIVLWRDYSGRRIYASLSDVNLDEATENPLVPITFGLTEVDYDENVD